MDATLWPVEREGNDSILLGSEERVGKTTLHREDARKGARWGHHQMQGAFPPPVPTTYPRGGHEQRIYLSTLACRRRRG